MLKYNNASLIQEVFASLDDFYDISHYPWPVGLLHLGLKCTPAVNFGL